MSGRRNDIELLRVVSAIGIVNFHLTGSNISYASLLIFTILSSFYSASRAKSNQYVDLLKRVKNLFTPWIFWMIFYGLINIYKTNNFFGYTHDFLLKSILTGTSIHLWFIPFIAITTVATDIIIKNFSSKTIAYSSWAVSIFLLLTANIWREQSISFGPPYAQYIHAISGVFIGCFFAHRHSLNNTLVSFLFLSLVCSTILTFGKEGLGLTYLIAIMCCSLVLTKENIHLRNISIQRFSSTMLGVYYIHPFIIALTHKYLLQQCNITKTIIVFLISTIIIFSLKSSFKFSSKIIG